MKRYSIFGYYGQRNAGDEAILAALIEGIKSASAENYISVYSGRVDETSSTHGIDAFVPFNFKVKHVFRNLIRRNPAEYLRAASNFLRTNVVVIGGGGLFFDSEESNKWLLYYLDLIEFAKALDKRVALIGVSAGPLHHAESRRLMERAFAKVDVISVRDNTSRDLLVECGVRRDRIEVVPDLVFTLASSSGPRIDEILGEERFQRESGRVVALTPCCYNVNRSGWLEQYRKFCERVVFEFGARLWFVPMQRDDDHDDLRAIQAIVTSLSSSAQSRISILQGVYTAQEVQGILGNADFILAERLHGAIMALNTSTPFVGISYMPKVAGVLELAQLQNRIVAMEDFLSGAYLEHAVMQMRSDLSGLSVELGRDSIAILADKNFKLLRTL
jgi:polysaccharide pyruvyl transferase CsaB